MKYRVKYFKDNIYTASTPDGRIIFVDGRGGEERHYYSPTELVLIAAGGCTLIDVEHILQKMKQNVNELMVDIEGRRTEEFPRIFKEVDVKYFLYGEIDGDRAIKAVELSISKYCSVLNMLRRAGAKIKCKIYVNDDEIYCNHF